MITTKPDYTKCAQKMVGTDNKQKRITLTSIHRRALIVTIIICARCLLILSLSVTAIFCACLTSLHKEERRDKGFQRIVSSNP